GFPQWQQDIQELTFQYAIGQAVPILEQYTECHGPEGMVRGCLLWLVGPVQLDFATSIAQACTRQHPEYLPGWCALFVCLASGWARHGKPGLVIEEFLHRAITVLDYICTQCMKAKCFGDETSSAQHENNEEDETVAAYVPAVVQQPDNQANI